MRAAARRTASVIAISIFLGGPNGGCILGFDTSLEPAPQGAGGASDVADTSGDTDASGDADVSDSVIAGDGPGSDGTPADTTGGTDSADQCSALPFEICGDCRDNDCDDVTDETECGTVAIIEIGATAEMPANYPIAVTFDHAAFVAAGAADDGSDVFVFSPSDNTEIPRVLDPLSSWNATDTELWFASPAEIAADGTVEYLLYIGPNPDAPNDDPLLVFPFADFFDRPDAEDPGMGWNVTEGGGADITLQSGALTFTASPGLENRPVADHDFPEISDGLFIWRFGFNWQRVGDEATYRVHMQLGDSAAMESPPEERDYLSNVGIGPSILWSSPNQGLTSHQGLGFEVDGSITQMGRLVGSRDVEIRVNLTGADPSFDVFVDGDARRAAASFSQSGVTQLDRMRFMTWRLDAENYEGRAIQYALVRPVISPEPTVTFSAEPATCN